MSGGPDPEWDEPLDDREEELAELRAGEGACTEPPLVLTCRCHCVEERELQVLAEAGCDLAEIARRTGATTGCTSCKAQVLALVAAFRRQPR